VFADVVTGDAFGNGLSLPELHVLLGLLVLALAATHVGLVLEHTVVRRHRHLARML
jgi:cytochrome b561